MAVKSDHNFTSVILSFEHNFDQPAFQSWINKNWTLSIWYAALYVMVIFAGKWYMKDRPRFELRMPLAIWSAVLGIFSIMGAVRTTPELIYRIYHQSFEASVCTSAYFYGPTAFWAYMFTISKVYELGDTVFIVLRKQPLIFLHWYHHITVLIYVWYSYIDNTAPGRWYMVMNYNVHSVMYSYYALRAVRVPIPKWINISITSLQVTKPLQTTIRKINIFPVY